VGNRSSVFKESIGGRNLAFQSFFVTHSSPVGCSFVARPGHACTRARVDGRLGLLRVLLVEPGLQSLRRISDVGPPIIVSESTAGWKESSFSDSFIAII
jgi:hypothetical protein